MIYITGDTHIPIDIEKLNDTLFPEQEHMTRDDYVIICGDFGGVWDNSERHKYWLKWLETRNFTVLFADGNHENYDMLEAYPVTEWHGGKVHVIADNIIHLMRGQVFVIDDKLFFVMGGASSQDKFMRRPYISWWPREMPTTAEYSEALKNLGEVGFDVDYIITHTAPTSIISEYYDSEDERPLNEFLQYISETTKYKRWFSGHLHIDRDYEGKHMILYDRIFSIDENTLLEERCKGYAGREI